MISSSGLSKIQTHQTLLHATLKRFGSIATESRWRNHLSSLLHFQWSELAEIQTHPSLNAFLVT